MTSFRTSGCSDGFGRSLRFGLNEGSGLSSGDLRKSGVEGVSGEGVAWSISRTISELVRIVIFILPV